MKGAQAEASLRARSTSSSRHSTRRRSSAAPASARRALKAAPNSASAYAVPSCSRRRCGTRRKQPAGTGMLEHKHTCELVRCGGNDAVALQQSAHCNTILFLLWARAPKTQLWKALHK